MGTAFALPCLDNNHDINIVGTHLEDGFIEKFKKNKLAKDLEAAFPDAKLIELKEEE